MEYGSNFIFDYLLYVLMMMLVLLHVYLHKNIPFTIQNPFINYNSVPPN